MKCNFTFLRGFVLFTLFLFAGGSVFAQGKTVQGTVTDVSGPVIGASILVQGTQSGTITGADGTYSINVPNNDAVLEVFFLGYQPAILPVGDQTVINVVLQQDAQVIDDVVVIGYGTVRRRDLTGAVGSVSSKTLANIPVANAAQALQGKLAGVNISSQDGRPGATMNISVRGNNSITGNNNPLVLVDGIEGNMNDIPADMISDVTVLKDASSTAIYGARGANGVILVTTKRATVGKATVSYSGYGSFNTPTGYLEALNPYDYLVFKWGLLDSYGVHKDSFEKVFGIGAYTDNNPGGIETYRNVAGYDAQKDVYNTSFSHSHDLSVSGGNESTKVRFSVGYNDEQGMKVQSWQKRLVASLKVDQQVFKNLNLNIDLRYTERQSVGSESASSGSGSILSRSYRFRPVPLSAIEEYGDPAAMGAIAGEDTQSLYDVLSPVNMLKSSENLVRRNGLRSTAGLTWNVIKGLTARSEISLSRGVTNTQNWTGPLAGGTDYYETEAPFTDYSIKLAGNADYRKQDSWTLRWSNTLTYDWVSKNNDHRLNVMAGQEITNSGGTDLRIQYDKFPANYTKENAFAMINMGGNNLRISSGVTTPDRLLSFFGRVNYSFLDRYLLTFTIRNDGSSKFSPEYQRGTFPGAAVAWRVSEEQFIKSVGWVNDLKFRLSYGSVGNDAISPSLWKQVYSAETGTNLQYGLDNLSQPSYKVGDLMPNRNLRWETTITRNIGLDYSLFNGRVWGSLDLYKNTTKDLLLVTMLPQQAGFTKTMGNVGQTSNKGIEFSVNGTIFQNNDWNVSASANIAFNRNNVDKLSANVSNTYGSQFLQTGFPAGDYILQVGRPIGIIRGWQMDGKGFYTTDDFTYDSATGQYKLKEGVPDQKADFTWTPGVAGTEGVGTPKGQTAYPGIPKFKDVNGDKVISNQDYVEIGDTNPKHTGGFNVNAQWKNLDLGLYFNWSYGNDVYNANKLASLYNIDKGGALLGNRMAFVKDTYRFYDIQNGKLVRVTKPAELDALNANATLPSIFMKQGYNASIGIEDGSFLRLNTVTLGYTLPKKLVAKAGISNLRIYGSIYNALTLTGYSGLDPEVSTNNRQGQDANTGFPTPGLDWGAYPRARQFVFGVNLNF
jgi:TonB-linked SusC/RagA family outer membrane protein